MHEWRTGGISAAKITRSYLSYILLLSADKVCLLCYNSNISGGICYDFYGQINYH